MPPRTKNASVSVDGTPINRRVPIVYSTESSSSEEQTRSESDAGSQEDSIRINWNPQRKGKGVAEEETEPLKPTEMFFPTTEYNKSIKIETRCSLWKTIKTLERVLTEKELKWFHDHPQFKHFFHMPELEPPVITEIEDSEEEAEPKKKKQKTGREKKPSQFKKTPFTAEGKGKARGRQPTRKAKKP